MLSNTKIHHRALPLCMHTKKVRVHLLCGLLQWGHNILMVPDWFIKGLVVYKTVYDCAHLKIPLGLFKLEKGIVPPSSREGDCFPAPGKGIVSQLQRRGLFPSSREGDCFPAPEKGIVSQLQRRGLFPAPEKGIVSQLQRRVLFPSSREGDCFPAPEKGIVSQLQRRGLFPSVADMPIKVTKGDAKLQLTNNVGTW